MYNQRVIIKQLLNKPLIEHSDRHISPRPLLMGVVNITPDSFSDGGQFLSADKALIHIEQLIDEGADIIDVGAESSRPGSTGISFTEELNRLEPIFKVYHQHFDTPLSLDTVKPKVVEWALDYKLNILNSILPIHENSEMLSVIDQKNIDVVCMHIQGTPSTMQENPTYENIVDTLTSFFEKGKYILQKTVKGDIILDPGIGFGKSVEDNLTLLKALPIFRDLGCPVLIGTSNKSFIGHITGRPPQDRLAGSLASQLWAIENGASIIRCHKVREMKEAMMIWREIKAIQL